MNYLAHLNRSLRLKFQPTYPYVIHEATDNEEWFCGRDVSLILGFQNIKRTLFEQIKKAHKTDLKSLLTEEKSEERLTAHYNEGRAVDNPGRYIAPSKLTKA